MRPLQFPRWHSPWASSARPVAEGDPMAARSVAEKLLIKPDTTLWSSDDSRLELVGPLPAGVRRVDAPEHATTALVFADDAASLRNLLATHQERLARLDILWVAYPRATGPISTGTACGRSSASSDCDR